ncbi:MAG: DUF2147 domain-containing protein [Hyphomicrobiales bacterium]|nr:DUF2147 domain-containing protein [Hyphomicrobiales bacterium]
MMQRLKLAALGLLLASCSMAGAKAADSVYGKWKRPDGSVAMVSACGGKLCGHLVSGPQTGYEMFHGMGKTGPDKWQGNKMKNPSAPGFMTFNGTAVLKGNTLSVQGCAIGQSMCGHENWTRVK